MYIYANIFVLLLLWPGFVDRVQNASKWTLFVLAKLNDWPKILIKISCQISSLKLISPHNLSYVSSLQSPPHSTREMPHTPSQRIKHQNDVFISNITYKQTMWRHLHPEPNTTPNEHQLLLNLQTSIFIYKNYATMKFYFIRPQSNLGFIQMYVITIMVALSWPFLTYCYDFKHEIENGHGSFSSMWASLVCCANWSTLGQVSLVVQSHFKWQNHRQTIWIGKALTRCIIVLITTFLLKLCFTNSVVGVTKCMQTFLRRPLSYL